MAHSFRGVVLWSLGLTVFGPVVAEITMKQEHFPSWCLGSKEKPGKGWVPSVPFKGMPSMSSILLISTPQAPPHPLKAQLAVSTTAREPSFCLLLKTLQIQSLSSSHSTEERGSWIEAVMPPGSAPKQLFTRKPFYTQDLIYINAEGSLPTS